MQQSCRCGEMTVMFLAGVAIGTAAGVLLAPHSGAYTRRHLENLADEVKEQACILASDFKDAVENVVQEGKRIIR
jgi:gas vesicle protein